VITIIIVLALLTQPTPPPRARWDGAGAATVEWTQTARGCLWHLPSTFVDCYDGAGRVHVGFGHHGPLDGALRPSAGTVYRVVVDGGPYDVPLESVVYFPVWQ
jgi:hypothetical protein